jgi:hypothetical protein
MRNTINHAPDYTYKALASQFPAREKIPDLTHRPETAYDRRTRPKPNIDTGGEFLCRLQGGKGGAARLRPWSPRQPLPKPHNVQGRSRRQMLEMGLGEPHIARLPEATPADALRMSTLDPCPRGILLAELFRRLPLTGLLQRLVRLTRLEPYDARLLFGSGALRPVRTRRAGLAGKAHLVWSKNPKAWFLRRLQTCHRLLKVLISSSLSPILTRHRAPKD